MNTLGSFLRPLDPGEAFFYLSDHVSCMNFVVMAERVGGLQPAQVRTALDIIQKDNTLLQASISWTEETGLCFVHTPGPSIELRCDASTLAAWQTTIEQQLSEPFATGASPLVRCLYVDLAPVQSADPAQPARSVLALCFHHAVADGRSGTELLRRMLSLMASGTHPPEADRPTFLPSMADVHPAHYRWTAHPAAAKALRNTLIGDYRRHGPLPAVPWLESVATQRVPQFIRMRFSSGVTQSLRAKARAEGTTLHGVLCAAQLLAQLELQPTGAPSTFFLSCPVDMRPHLEPEQPVTPTGLFTSLISATFEVQAGTDFWQLARDIIIQTRLQLARGEGHLLYHLYGLDGSPVLPHQLEPFRKKALASLPNTMVSNLGAVAAVAEDPAVETISFALCPMPYQTLFTAASSYQDQLVLNVGFDAARVTPANAQVLTRRMQHLLHEAADAISGTPYKLP